MAASHWEIVNESSLHRAQLGLESHFKILIVSSVFIGLSRVQRQREAHQLFAAEMEEGIHALSLRLLTPDEWSKMTADSFVSPKCRSHN